MNLRGIREQRFRFSANSRRNANERRGVVLRNLANFLGECPRARLTCRRYS